MGLNNIIQPSQTWADIVSNKTQEKLPVTTVVQKSPIIEIGPKRISTLPVETFEKKRHPLPQRPQDASDGMNMESTNVVNTQMGHENSGTDNDNTQMDVPDEQENRGKIISSEDRKTSVPSSDNEREMQGNSQLVGEDAIILETHAEGLGLENNRLEGMPSTDILSDGVDQKEEIHKSQSSLNGVRSKWLKTDREDPVIRIRNRSKSKTKTTYK